MFKSSPIFRETLIVVMCVAGGTLACLPNVVVNGEQECPKGVRCPKPTPTRTPRPSASPKLLEERPAGFVPIRYTQNVSGVINWRERKTGANRQPNNQFTLYNDYYLDARRTDDLTIRFVPSLPQAMSRWSIELNEVGVSGNKRIIPLKQTKIPGEYRLDSSLPVDGRYHILVKCADVEQANVAFSGKYTLMVTAASKSSSTPTPTPTVSPTPPPSLAALERRCADNLTAGDMMNARNNCEKVLKLNGKVRFDVKTGKDCWDKIDLNDLREISREPDWKLEIQNGGIEILNKPAKHCFDPAVLKSRPEVWVFLQKDMRSPNQREQIIVEIREFKVKGDPRSEVNTYRLFPVSRNLEEAKLIRDLIDTYFSKKR